MADRRSLGFIGLAFSGITFTVMLIGCVVVKAHLDGRLILDGTPQPAVAASIVKHLR